MRASFSHKATILDNQPRRQGQLISTLEGGFGVSIEQSEDRPYQDYGELDLYETLHELQDSYAEADRERDRIIEAYDGTSAVLEDDEYRSATQKRSQISDEIT